MSLPKDTDTNGTPADPAQAKLSYEPPRVDALRLDDQAAEGMT